MDETTLVGDLRANAPTPDRGRLAPGRQRLLDGVAKGGWSRRLRADWRTASVGAAAAITAAAVAATLVGGGDRDDRPESLMTASGTVNSARQVLLDAATMVENDKPPAPGVKQWIYSRTSSYNVTVQASSRDDVTFVPVPERDGLPARGGKAVTMAGPGPHTSEQWTPYTLPAAEKDTDDDDYSPRAIYDFLAQLPDDQDKVLAEVLKFYPSGGPGHPETPDQHAFRALGVVAGEHLVHPGGLAKVYRAMADLPGIYAHRITDIAGRDTVAIGMKDDGVEGQDRLLLLNPDTAMPTGEQWTATKDSPTEHSKMVIGGKKIELEVAATWKKGDVVMSDVVLEQALVDKDEQRP